jgi:hypothetical protein
MPRARSFFAFNIEQFASRLAFFSNLLARGRGVELVDVLRGNGRRNTAGPQILGMDVRALVMAEHVAPLPPATLMAPIGLLIRHYLPEPFDDVTYTRWKYPW